MHSSAKAGHFLIMVFLENKAEGATFFFGKNEIRRDQEKEKGQKMPLHLIKAPEDQDGLYLGGFSPF